MSDTTPACPRAGVQYDSPRLPQLPISFCFSTPPPWVQVSSVTGSKVLRILKKHGLAPEIPEDLYHLIKKAVSMRKHLEQFRKDRDGKFRLILVESRIHRLARYYKVLPGLGQDFSFSGKGYRQGEGGGLEC